MVCGHVGSESSDWSQNGWRAANWAKPYRAAMTSFCVSAPSAPLGDPEWGGAAEGSCLPLLDSLRTTAVFFMSGSAASSGGDTPSAAFILWCGGPVISFSSTVSLLHLLREMSTGLLYAELTPQHRVSTGLHRVSTGLHRAAPGCTTHHSAAGETVETCLYFFKPTSDSRDAAMVLLQNMLTGGTCLSQLKTDLGSGNLPSSGVCF